jgi:hypothetical protein
MWLVTRVDFSLPSVADPSIAGIITSSRMASGQISLGAFYGLSTAIGLCYFPTGRSVQTKRHGLSGSIVIVYNQNPPFHGCSPGTQSSQGTPSANNGSFHF